MLGIASSVACERFFSLLSDALKTGVIASIHMSCHCLLSLTHFPFTANHQFCYTFCIINFGASSTLFLKMSASAFLSLRTYDLWLVISFDAKLQDLFLFIVNRCLAKIIWQTQPKLFSTLKTYFWPIFDVEKGKYVKELVNKSA